MAESSMPGLRDGAETADAEFSSDSVDGATSQCDDGTAFVSDGATDDELELEAEHEAEDDEVEFDGSSLAEADDDSEAYVDDPE